MPNIYYEPEAFGLQEVAEIDYSTGSYEFDTRVVWKVKGHLIFYTARDSGCSCPTPFEDYYSPIANVRRGWSEDKPIDKLNFDALRREVMYELSEEGYNHTNISPDRAQEFLEKVRNAAAVK